VGGVQYAPVIRPGARPRIDEGAVTELDEADRPAEVARFTAAAAAVADRLRARAGHATGVASEVLATTATLAQDRAWLADAEKRINGGSPAVQAVAGAIDKIAVMFTQLGGLMAERVTDLRDVRDRVIADLSGLPEPGVPVPDVPVWTPHSSSRLPPPSAARPVTPRSSPANWASPASSRSPASMRCLPARW
jgi:phosphotransferase system enzyme I (PtsI)